MKEVLRHIWKGVWQLLRGGETVFHSFLFEYFGQAIRYFKYSWGAA